MRGTQERLLGSLPAKFVVLKFLKIKTWQNFPLEIGILIRNFQFTNEVHSETSNIKLELRIYMGTLDVF